MYRYAQEIARSAVRKASWILLPTLIFTGMLSYIDRSNLAYAATTVKKAVKINNSQYGLASGILYISYCFFQVIPLTLSAHSSRCRQQNIPPCSPPNADHDSWS